MEEKKSTLIIDKDTVSIPMVISESVARRIVESECGEGPLAQEEKELRKKLYHGSIISANFAGRINAAAKKFGMKGKIMSKEELEKDYNIKPVSISPSEVIPELVGIFSSLLSDEKISHYIDFKSARTAMILGRSDRDRDVERIKKWKKEDGKAKYTARIGWGKKKSTPREHLLHLLRFHSVQQYKFSRKHLLDA